MQKRTKLCLFFLCMVWMTFPALADIRYKITGIKDSPLENSQKALNAAEMNETAREQALTEEQIQSLFDRGPSEIELALKPYGYFFPSIRSNLVHDGKHWIFNYNVDPGPPLTISQITIEIDGPGKNDPVFQTMIQNFPLKVGDRFTVENYEQAKQLLFEIAINNGYIKAKFGEQNAEIDLDRNTAIVDIHLHTGERFYFGPINFFNADLSDSFLDRFVTFKQGDPYSSAEVLQLQQALSASGYFGDLSVQPMIKNNGDDVVPLNFYFTPLKLMNYSVGGGYGTDTGFRGSLGWQWRRVNDLGHYFNAQYNISQIGSSVAANYYIPGLNPITQVYNFGALLADYSTDAGSSKLGSANATYTDTETFWQTSYSLIYLYETYAFSGQAEANSHLIMPSVTWMHLNTDDILHPTYGSRITVNVRGSAEAVASSTNFTQLTASFHNLYGLGYRNRIFTRTDIGATWSDNYNEIPLSLWFTAGGSQSVRGYGYQSLGPGKYLFVASQEYQFRVYGNWFLAAFHDIGNAFNNFNDIGLQQSAGIGVVWESPIGLMELDAVRTLTGDAQTWGVSFNIGGLL